MLAALVLVSLAIGGNGSVLVQPFIVWESSFFVTSVSVGPNAVYAAGGNQVRRFDLNGTLVWTAEVDSFVASLAADPNGVYVVGSALNSNYNGVGFQQRNATLARLNSSGDLVWSRQLTTSQDPSTSSWGSAVTVDSTGIYVAGYTTVFNRYPQYGWVGKTDNNGTQLWVQRLDPIAVTSTISSGVRVVYLSGFSRGCLGSTNSDICPIQAYLTAVDPDGQILWARQIPSYCGPTSHSSSCDYEGAPQTFAQGVSADASGVFVSGTTQGVIPGQVATSTGRGASDAFAGRYSLNGTELWLKQFGTSFQNNGYGISTGSRGTFMVASDGLRRFDANGNQVWLFNLDFAARSISTSPRSIILSGYTSIAEVCAMPSCVHSQ